MNLGIDLGTSTVKLALMENGKICFTWRAQHRGNIIRTLREGLAALRSYDARGGAPLQSIRARVTGANRGLVVRLCPEMQQMEEIPAIVEGVKLLCPEARSVIEIGSQSARYITDIDSKAPAFSVNEHCAGGTGSFFEDQMSRLGLDISDYSRLAEQARSVPNISGRCAVFAKTDIIHRQQEGVPKQDILMGLCAAMIRNYKATIVKGLPVNKPVAFCGGVTLNSGVASAIKKTFGLGDGELIIPENALFAGAVGAAASEPESEMSLDDLQSALSAEACAEDHDASLTPLKLAEGTVISEPARTGRMPADGAYIGVDIGSTSTDIVLMGSDGSLIDFQYMRTAGDPEGVVRRGFAEVKEKYGEFDVLGVGVTGSGRERLGRMMGADAIRDEITAQARAASYWAPDADTVFEIGGQDSKYIYLKDGRVVDFQMNKICAAGTGSFVEEQAARMGVPIDEFGPLALTGERPRDLGERCTVFIETSIAQAEAQGASQADIAAGLCHSIVKNYLNKVVSGKPVGERIVLQGGVNYNPGIVAAFQSAYGDKVSVSPVFSISGAFGAALLAREECESRVRAQEDAKRGAAAASAGSVGPETRKNVSGFAGFDFPHEEKRVTATSEEIRRNKAFYKKAGQLVVEDYDGTIDPRKKTIGVPLTLIMFKFFPMVNAFFKNLGFNVVLSKPTDEETISLSQQYAQGETCYPVKLIYGHMMQLAEQGVDYIFLPSVHTIRHPHAHAAHNYACPYMQMGAKIVFDDLGLKKRGIKLLSPVLDLDLGAKMMGLAMLDTGKSLGFPRPRCVPGLIKGAFAVNKYMQDVEGLGHEMMATLRPEDKVLVLITRNYGISDPVLNMGIPEILLQRGYKVMTLGHLPGMSLDISADYPHMYWPFGDHLLSGAKLIANHPNLYAVYLTNHGCGPDTLISHMFREEMGDKPYLQIEVDEHYSKVGVITRIEAFLNSISNRPPAKLPENFDILNVRMKAANIQSRPDASKKLLIPYIGCYTRYIADYFRRQGINAETMKPFTHETLALGRTEMNSKEYLPLPMLVGACLQAIRDNAASGGNDADIQFLIPYGYGADADGQYARAVRTILDRLGHTECGIAAPMLEELPDSAADIELLIRALLTGDVVYALDSDVRAQLAPERIPELDELVKLAEKVNKSEGRVIAAVGSPMCVTSLDEGILAQLESEGNEIRRMPFSEMMRFLWKDNGRETESAQTEAVAAALMRGGIKLFSEDVPGLFASAQSALDSFAGNHGRYRFAKALEMGDNADAVLMMSPRYENTAVVLQLRGMQERCHAPLFELSLDGDWDESGWSRLRSFLYYC